MKQVGVAILGFGTVGAGVADCLVRRRAEISARAGIDVSLACVADLDVATDRGVCLDGVRLTTDAREAIADKRVDIVVETIGGTGIAKTLMLEAIDAGKAVVTANKKLLAEDGASIFDAARSKGVDIYFGAAVGGGIPVVRAVRDALAANTFKRITGILNGTCNYILTRMEEASEPFDRVLAEAQRLGFAEADPSLDVDGWDTAHKICILANLAFGVQARPGAIEVRGIRGISPEDIEKAASEGRRIKLLGKAERTASGVEVSVGPVALSRGELLSGVNGVYNAIAIESEPAGTTAYIGKGAGRDPTASTVAGDICEIARNLARGVTRCGRLTGARG